MLKKGLIVLAWLQMVVSAQALVYKLEKVTSIVTGEKYVFVDNGNAVKTNEIYSTTVSVLQRTNSFKFSGLVGNEDYVLTLNNYGNQTSYAIEFKNYFVGKKSNNNLIELQESASFWNFSFDKDSLAQISSGNYYFTYNESKGYTAYTQSYYTPSKFSVYRLVPEEYERKLTQMNIGTICLPYAVDKVTGAEVYELSYLENDAQGNPYKVYYEQQVSAMVAGKPYIFVPNESTVKFQRASTTEQTAQHYNGFYGTFNPIEDVETGNANNKLEGMYLLSGNMFVLCTDYCKIGANRGYFNLKETATTPPASAAQRRVLAIGQGGIEYIEPGLVTSVRNMPFSAQSSGKAIVNGKMVITRNGQNYTILGGRL